MANRWYKLLDMPPGCIAKRNEGNDYRVTMRIGWLEFCVSQSSMKESGIKIGEPLAADYDPGPAKAKFIAAPVPLMADKPKQS